jgi:hypothetical protein
MEVFLFRKTERLPEGRTETFALSAGENEHDARKDVKLGREWERVYTIEAMPHTSVKLLPTKERHFAVD